MGNSTLAPVRCPRISEGIHFHIDRRIMTIVDSSAYQGTDWNSSRYLLLTPEPKEFMIRDLVRLVMFLTGCMLGASQNRDYDWPYAPGPVEFAKMIGSDAPSDGAYRTWLRRPDLRPSVLGTQNYVKSQGKADRKKKDPALNFFNPNPLPSLPLSLRSHTGVLFLVLETRWQTAASCWRLRPLVRGLRLCRRCSPSRTRCITHFGLEARRHVLRRL